MKIQEATKWLRSLMRTAGVGAKDAHPLGTHSLKATCLSWCAKWGVERQTRALLGFHSKGKDGTELVYGRDNMSAPLRELNVVISAVASGSFEGCVAFRHQVTCMIHAVADEAGDHFKCGRKVSTAYIRVDAPRFLHPMCKQCRPPE